MSNNGFERLIAATDLGPGEGRLVEAVVLVICAGVLVAATAWLLASVAVCTADALVIRAGRGLHPRVSPFRPRCVQVLVALLLGPAGAALPGPALAERGTALPGILPGL